jgi:hypothetical protein
MRQVKECRMPYASTMYAEIGFACAEWISLHIRQDAKGQVPGCLASVHGAVIIRSTAVGAAKRRH